MSDLKQNQLIISQLTEEDSKDVHELAQAASFKTLSDHSSGFLYNPLTLDAYRERLKICKLSLKATINNITAGYALNITSDDIEVFTELGIFNQKNKVIDAVKKTAQNKKFLYVEQLVINQEFRKSGVGRALHSATVSLAKDNGLSHAISEIGHAPAPNNASISFVKSHGWRQVGEVENSGRIYGLYSIDF